MNDGIKTSNETLIDISVPYKYMLYTTYSHKKVYKYANLHPADINKIKLKKNIHEKELSNVNKHNVFVLTFKSNSSHS